MKVVSLGIFLVPLANPGRCFFWRCQQRSERAGKPPNNRSNFLYLFIHFISFFFIYLNCLNELETHSIDTNADADASRNGTEDNTDHNTAVTNSNNGSN
jgi:hypothetical protein